LIPLSTQPDAAPLAGFVRTADPVIWEQVGVIPFALGALMLYVLLYQSRLVPRWLSTWGLVGATLYIVPALGSMFGHDHLLHGERGHEDAERERRPSSLCARIGSTKA
jgi:hypothetical protein